MPTRIVTRDIRTVNGITVEVQGIKRLEYTGEWAPAGFYVMLNDKRIGNFWGWPTDDDIAKVLAKSA
jgi:hypothetical protein